MPLHLSPNLNFRRDGVSLTFPSQETDGSLSDLLTDASVEEARAGPDALPAQQLLDEHSRRDEQRHHVRDAAAMAVGHHAQYCAADDAAQREGRDEHAHEGVAAAQPQFCFC